MKKHVLSDDEVGLITTALRVAIKQYHEDIKAISHLPLTLKAAFIQQIDDSGDLIHLLDAAVAVNIELE